MQFDPMTGEPIEEQQNEENMQFDPMTARRRAGEVVQRAQGQNSDKGRGTGGA